MITPELHPERALNTIDKILGNSPTEKELTLHANGWDCGACHAVPGATVAPMQPGSELTSTTSPYMPANNVAESIYATENFSSPLDQYQLMTAAREHTAVSADAREAPISYESNALIMAPALIVTALAAGLLVKTLRAMSKDMGSPLVEEKPWGER